DGHGVTLVATDAAFEALGIETDSAPKASKKPKDRRADKPARKMREGSKQAQLIAMLGRAKGASIDEVVDALCWQPHTVRGAIAGALKKKLGLNVTSEKVDGRGRVYRIED
ncbi:MAG: DUF3489 domain-containing protein, partial [Gallionellaceae bacterium]|nr:DUF3489 domain-containing protein [Gallionellaceae bacterium]